MLPHYIRETIKPTRWERFKWWLDDIMPYVWFFGIIGGICLFFWFMMPRCPECDSFIHPMDAYCGKCGHQLRTYTDVRD